MKIGISGMATESCTFSTLPTRRDDFHILRGDEFAASYPFLAAYPDSEFSFGVVARALPGGPIERGAYDAIKSALLSHLRDAGPFDGVYLDMHGAMHVAGMEDAEGDLLSAIRHVVGEDCLLAASYDLHGNVSRGGHARAGHHHWLPHRPAHRPAGDTRAGYGVAAALPCRRASSAQSFRLDTGRAARRKDQHGMAAGRVDLRHCSRRHRRTPCHGRHAASWLCLG